MNTNEIISDISKTWKDPTSEALLVLALCGEVGELANLFKKKIRHNNDATVRDIIDGQMTYEIIDIIFYAFKLLDYRHTPFEVAWKHKFLINKKKYGVNDLEEIKQQKKKVDIE